MKASAPNDNTARKAVISSGNMELDAKMGGGLPIGSLALIEGMSGAGKSVLTQQLMYGALRDGFRVSVFTSENTVKSLISQMHSIDMSVLNHVLLGKFRIFPMALARLGENAPSALLDAIRQESRADIIVLDSINSAISTHTTALRIRAFFEQAKQICATGKTLLITMLADESNASIASQVRSLCDAHLNLRATQDGQRMVKTLEVLKIRGASSSTGAIVGFEVEPGWGMRVIPISKARG